MIANTVKGKGVSFIEDRVEWHHKVPSRRAGPDRFAGAERLSTVAASTGRVHDALLA